MPKKTRGLARGLDALLPETETEAITATEVITATEAVTETQQITETQGKTESETEETEKPTLPAWQDNPPTGDKVFPGSLLSVAVLCLMLGICLWKYE